MRTLRGVLVGAIAVVLSSVGLTPPAVAAGLTPPSAPYTAFSLHFEGWGLIDGSFSYENPRTGLTVIQPVPETNFALQMDGSYLNRWHNLNVSPPTGTRFVAGQSYPTTVGSSPSPTTTVLNISTGGANCLSTTSQGTLNVLEANYDDATGKFTAFAANYSVSCGNNRTATGEIRFQSSIGYRATDSWNYQLDLGQQPVGMDGDPQSVTFYVDGTEPTTFGDASLSGANPDAFQITNNTCSGQTLSYGQTCAVRITPKATALGSQTALLTVPENSIAGRVIKQLSLTGVDPWDATASPAYLDFGNAVAYDTSAPQTVTLTGATDNPITFGAASITGANAAYFKITSDGCSNATLARSQTCSITVVTRPAPDTQDGAAIVLPDNSLAGSTQILMKVNGYDNGRGTYYPTTPNRVLDTRSGIRGPKGLVGSGDVVHLQVTGFGGVPADASTVVLNVTVTGATSSGYITVYPTGVPNRPTASSVNFVKGWTGANSVTVKIGANGQVDFYVAGGPTYVIADVFGYYTKGHVFNFGLTGAQYQPLAQPLRLTDTRDWGKDPIPAGYYINSAADFGANVNPQVKAFAVNITATAPVGSGYLTAWNGDSNTLPDTSTLNYTKGATVPNFAVVPTMACQDCGTATGLPSIGVYTANASHIIVDIVGFYADATVPDGLRFNPVVPTRIVDTRSALGWPSRLGPAVTATVTTPGSLADIDTMALATNVTAVLPTTSTYLTVWPAGIDGVGRPDTSNLNPTAGSVVPNAVQTMIGPNGQFDIYNAGGYCDVVVDVVGTFEMYPPTPPSDWNTLQPALKASGTNPDPGSSLVTPTAHSPARAKRL